MSTPPFQYSHRATMYVSLDGQMRAAIEEQRDRELEDFLAWMEAMLGGLVVMGTFPTPGPPTTAQVPTKAKGDIWIDSNGNGWSWNGTAWVNIGPIQGPTGPPGPQGIPGPQGPPGTGGGGTGTDEVWIGADDPIAANPTIELWYDTDDPGGPATALSYVHNQGVAAATWTITHNLGWFPNVLVIDSALSVCEGEITQISENTLRLQFSAAFAGTAYLS